jgi:hypothetical protein
VAARQADCTVGFLTLPPARPGCRAMAKDAISKRLESMVSYMWQMREQLDGDSPAGMFDDIEPRDSTFELFGLDPKKPRDHKFLLFLLDNVIFSKGRAGAPKKWSEWGRGPIGPHHLDADVATVNGRSKKSVREICRILIEDKDKRFEERYANIPFEALRHRVRNIKKPLGNN